MKSLTPYDLKWLEQTLAKLQEDVTIVYFTEEVNCRHCQLERDLLTGLAGLSHKLHLEVYNFTAPCENPILSNKSSKGHKEVVPETHG